MSIRTKQAEKEQVKEIAKKFKGTFINFPDGSYKVAGVLDSVIEYELGNISYEQTGSPSRLK